MSNLLGFEFHKGDRVRVKDDGRCGVVTKSYCDMTGWCDEFRVVVCFDDGTARDLATWCVEKEVA